MALFQRELPLVDPATGGLLVEAVFAYRFGMSFNIESRVFVAGHRGLVGSAILRQLQARGFRNVITRTRQELDLLDRESVRAFYAKEKPECVFLAAAKVGGIAVNHAQPASFLIENLEIQNNVIYGAHEANVEKLLFLGSSCIYPKFSPQPIREEYLLSGALEPTNEWYAIAKIAGLKLCQALRRQHGRDYISAMPTNMYGPNDNYHLENSHVLPALIRKFHEAKVAGAATVTCWGSGRPTREFLYADDLATACLLLMEKYDEETFINVGSGQEISIKELSEIVTRITGFSGQIVWDESRPDGTPRKLLDSTRIFNLGWRPAIDLEEGIRRAYADFQEKLAHGGKFER